MSSFLAVVFVALILLWKGPSCIASMRFKQEQLTKKIRKEKRLQQQINHAGGIVSSDSPSSSSSSSSGGSNTGCWSKGIIQ